MSGDSLSLELTRPNNVANILGVLYRAVSDLELKVLNKGQVAFAAGEVYDFFKELNKVVGSADISLFIVDPYLDHTVFDHYLNSRKPNVTARLLLHKYANSVKPAAQKYIQQHGGILDLRKSEKIHDRVIFVDGYVCWVVGQSLKDAAKAKPTYLAPLAPDVVTAKLQDYEVIWSGASAI